MLKLLKPLTDTLTEILYPTYCQICEQRTTEVICEECEPLFLPQSGTYCQRCAEQVHHSVLTEHGCVYCQKETFYFSYVVVGYVMNPHLRHVIHRFKYAKGLYLLPFLSRCLLGAFQDERISTLSPEQWVMTSVPVHPIRERERGYNQAHLLATAVAPKVSFPYEELLNREYHTTHMAGLNKKERAEKIQSAFSVKPEVDIPKNILLIDDVFTTGATSNGCTKVLKKAGAERVIVVCLARR